MADPFIAVAKHVIVTTSKIDDRAQTFFTEALYKGLLEQRKTVCVAFKNAVQQMRRHQDPVIKGEWDKYVLKSQCNSSGAPLKKFAIGDLEYFDPPPQYLSASQVDKPN